MWVCHPCGIKMSVSDLQERKKLEREQKRLEIQNQKDLNKAIKQATAASRQETKPGERIKQMIVMIGKQLSEDGVIMTTLLTRLQELEVEYRICEDTPTCVMWKRKVVERSIDDTTKVIELKREQQEQYILVVMNGSNFLELVHYTKQDHKGINLNDGESTLIQEVDRLQRLYNGYQITLAVYDLEAALRGLKTQRNRKFRAAVRESQQLCSDSEKVSRIDCEEAMAELQINKGMNCCIRICHKPEQLADLIITHTKSISAVPFQKEQPFSFYGDLGPGATQKALQQCDNKISLIWQHQLLQFSSVSNPIAAAIVAVYPSPAHLLEAYENCSKEQAENLLQDIQVRRGVGVTSSTRKVGKVISNRIYLTMTSKDKDLLLP